MTTTLKQTDAEPANQSIKRRGLIAAAWTAVAAFVVRQTTQRVEAAASLQFGNVASSLAVDNTALGPTVIVSGTTYPTTSAVFTGQAIDGSAICGLQGVSGLRPPPPMTCGVHAYNSLGVSPAAGLVAESNYPPGFGAIGRSGTGGTGSGIGVQGESASGIGVRGLINSSQNAIAVYGLNTSSYTGPGPGAGGFGVYGLSANGHGLVGATATAGGAAVVGATNGVAGAYAAAFYGPALVGGALTVFGAKSAALPHPDGSRRLVYCVESPDSWLEDFGAGQLECGQAEVKIDPDFAAVADLSTYHVFLTGYDIEQPLYVTHRTPSGFTVKVDAAIAALKGTHERDLSGQFSWRIVGKRKDIETKRLAPVTFPPEPTCPDLATIRTGVGSTDARKEHP
jgi:hypothetical protein